MLCWHFEITGYQTPNWPHRGKLGQIYLLLRSGDEPGPYLHDRSSLWVSLGQSQKDWASGWKWDNPADRRRSLDQRKL